MNVARAVLGGVALTLEEVVCIWTAVTTDVAGLRVLSIVTASFVGVTGTIGLVGVWLLTKAKQAEYEAQGRALAQAFLDRKQSD